MVSSLKYDTSKHAIEYKIALKRYLMKQTITEVELVRVGKENGFEKWFPGILNLKVYQLFYIER